ncbi:MAG TPA: cation-transporting P-type ATPase [Candidatus Limnocylindrales bacterium]|nr:cation-transporting P-type ATPase [Candidatus Limnocylindrales bacterium]
MSLLGTSLEGLTSEEAARRRERYGPNAISLESRSIGAIVRGQISGINILLGLAGVLTLATGDVIDGVIILVLIVVNVGLSIFQEYRAERALGALRALLPFRTRVWRDGAPTVLPSTELVPGDLIALETGDLVPADCRVLEADALMVNQATLTGESEPAAKDPAPVAATHPSEWTSLLLAGTMVVEGRGRAVVIATGASTFFGQTAALVHGGRAPGDFQANLARFGGFLLRFGVVLSAIVLVANVLLGRGVVVSITLALALVLGMVPEALPAVTATALALGAASLARKQVLVRRLAAIEDLSAVDILCSDKTGTITENRTAVAEIWTRIDPGEVLQAALLTTPYPQPGGSIVDQALLDAAKERGLPLDALAGLHRTTVVPFTSQAKRTSVLVVRNGDRELISKGMASVILQRCTRMRTPEGDVDLAPLQAEAEAAVARCQRAGARVLAVASRPVASGEAAPVDDRLVLLGILAFSDPARPGAAAALKRAEALGVTVKIVTGDAVPRAAALAEQIGIPLAPDAVVSADQLRGSDIHTVAERARIFAEVVPEDKYRLVKALQANGHHVAVTGDGVNDAPALNTADVGIAVASGSDAAKGAADLILLRDDLGVIIDGLQEGRRIFTSITRYLLYTMVSNFANVLIVAVASLFLSYLPLLPDQVLLLNILADVPMLAIVTDRVAWEDLATPRRWSIRSILELSLYLGVVNALFTFGLLKLVAAHSPTVARTEWFLFLGSTALIILFVVRSPGWFWEGPKPSWTLLLALGACFALTIALINLPVTRDLLGFAPLSWQTQLVIEAYGLAYLVLADVIMRAYHRVVPLAHRVQ